MDLLLDTHAFVWFLNGDNQLPVSVRYLIADTSNRCFFSIASLWEIAIKNSLGKLNMQGSFSQLANFLNENAIEVLPVTFEHIQRLLQLEYLHRDPFDRMILAQSLTENITLVSKDDIFRKYGATLLWK
ncbi:MAG: type II toxin-antitoxin system VapC family toxin [Chitinophagaceae bacterium]|nr:MAG: type II toxin-antitoxin system VapC family toxin [Chitinophagaceae bacterium]